MATTVPMRPGVIRSSTLARRAARGETALEDRRPGRPQPAGSVYRRRSSGGPEHARRSASDRAGEHVDDDRDREEHDAEPDERGMMQAVASGNSCTITDAIESPGRKRCDDAGAAAEDGAMRSSRHHASSPVSRRSPAGTRGTCDPQHLPTCAHCQRAVLSSWATVLSASRK